MFGGFICYMGILSAGNGFCKGRSLSLSGTVCYCFDCLVVSERRNNNTDDIKRTDYNLWCLSGEQGLNLLQSFLIKSLITIS